MSACIIDVLLISVCRRGALCSMKKHVYIYIYEALTSRLDNSKTG
jgi:hypothetical protein